MKKLLTSLRSQGCGLMHTVLIIIDSSSTHSMSGEEIMRVLHDIYVCSKKKTNKMWLCRMPFRAFLQQFPIVTNAWFDEKSVRVPNRAQCNPG